MGGWDPNKAPITLAGPTLCHISSFSYFTLNVIWKTPINSSQCLFSSHTVPPIPRPLALAQLRPISTTPHQQALHRPCRRLLGSDYVLQRNLAPISPRSPHAVSSNAICTLWGHDWSPEHTSKGRTTIFLDPVLKHILPCMSVNQNNG